MKTTVTTKKAGEKAYPWVGINNSNGHVVLFLDRKWGVTLQTTVGHPIVGSDWHDETLYTPCTITLSSEE